MIGFLAPWMLAIAGGVALAVTALHFLSVRRPPAYALPTARFVVAKDVRAVSRSARPSDLLLLLLRVFAILCAGAALAGPRWVSSRAVTTHVLVADPAWRADSARLPGLAGLDSAPAGVGASGDADVRIVWADSVHGMRTELGAAWPLVWRAVRESVASNPAVDSVSVHVFAPVGSESHAGWAAWRAAWPGRVTLHSRAVSSAAVPATAADVVEAPGLLVREAGADDAVQAAFALHVPRAVRTAANAGTQGGVALDTREANGAPVIRWPASGVPEGWTPSRDTVGALVVNGHALVAPWVRTSRAPDSTRGARVLARWGDGAPAVLESGAGSQCVRTVGIAVPNGSDVLLTPSARELLRALAAPCARSAAALPVSLVEDRGGVTSLAAVSVLRRVFPRDLDATPRWLPAVLLGLALAALLAELWLRGADDTRTDATADASGERA